MRTLTFLLCFCINTSYGADSCLNVLVDKAYNPNFKADYFLFLPVQSVNGKKARLMILKENFRKYMIAIDSSFTYNDKLKNYVKELLAEETTFIFQENFYTQNFSSGEYKILTEKNQINIKTPGKIDAFLNKYLINFSSERSYFNVDIFRSIESFYFVYETLFKLKYLVANSDGSIAVIRVNCK